MYRPILLIDADGVTIKKHGLFSEKFSREYGVPIEKIIPFFKNEFKQCQRGAADLKHVLEPYLKEWGWEKSVDDFLKYWFESDTTVDENVMKKLRELQALYVTCILVTDQEKYRAEYIQNNLNFRNRMTDSFFSYQLGCSKSSSEFFEKIIEIMNTDRRYFVYLDDDEENIKAALDAGIDARLYSDPSSLEEIKNIQLNF